MLFLAACTDGGASTPTASSGKASAAASATDSATVTGAGFVVTDGSTEISGGPGVAPAGTAVRMRSAKSPKVPTEVHWKSAAPGFDISLAGDLQPAAPVTVTAQVTSGEPAQKLVFVTQNSTTGAWEGLPVTQSGDKATVKLSHFSGGWFGWVKDPAPAFKKALNDYLKLRFDAPACQGKPLELAGTTYSAKVNGNGIRVCVEEEGDAKPHLTVHSNSPFVWRVLGQKGSVGPGWATSPVELSGAATIASYKQLYPQRATETVLVPGGRSGMELLGSGEWRLSADVDAALGLVAIAIAGFDMLPGVSLPMREAIALGECAAGLLDTSLKPDAGKVMRAVIDCFGTLVKDSVAVVVAIFSSLSSLLVTQVVGYAGEVFQTNHLKITVSSTTAEPADQKVGPDSTRGTGTTVTTINPFTSTGLKTGWKLDRSNPNNIMVSCYGASANAVGPGTLTCGITADGANACWRGDSAEPEVWCLDTFDPESKTLRVLPATDVPQRTEAPEEAEPLFLELEDGSIWFDRYGGAWGGRADGLVGIAGCINDVGICAGKNTMLLASHDAPGIDRSGKYWKVKAGELGDPGVDYPEPTSMTVSRAWFMSGRP